VSIAEGTDSEARWAAAAALVAGVPDAGMTGRRRRTIVLAIALPLVASALGVGLGLVLVHSPVQIHRPSGSDSVFALILVAVGLLIMVGGMIWGFVTKRSVPRWRSVIAPLNRAEKKWAYRAIRGKVPLDQRRLPVLVALAIQSRRVTEWFIPTYSGIALVYVAVALTSDLASIRWMEFLVVLLYVALFVWMLVAYRRQGLFLQANAPGAQDDLS
jgi:hypothetical protein